MYYFRSLSRWFNTDLWSLCVEGLEVGGEGGGYAIVYMDRGNASQESELRKQQ